MAKFDWKKTVSAVAPSLAAALGERWQKLGLYWIFAARPNNQSFVYELRDQEDKLRVVWGAALGNEAVGEPAPAAKLAALERQLPELSAAQGGSPTLVDLRSLATSARDTLGDAKLPAANERQKRKGSEKSTR